MARALSAWETVRAEEIVIQVPGGRTITTLVNATPIPSDEPGGVDSCRGDLAGPDAAAGSGAAAGRVPGHGQSRAARPADLHQGGGRHPAGRPFRAGHPAEMVGPFARIIDRQADHMSGLIHDSAGRGPHRDRNLAGQRPEPASVASLLDQARATFPGSGGAGQPADRSCPRIFPPCWPTGCASSRSWATCCPTPPGTRPGYRPHPGIGAWREEVHVADSVTDRGQGVPAGQLPHLFRKFPRLGGADREEAAELRRPGTGPGHLQGHRGSPRRPHPGRERSDGRPGNPASPSPSPPSRRPGRSLRPDRSPGPGPHAESRKRGSGTPHPGRRRRPGDSGQGCAKVLSQAGYAVHRNRGPRGRCLDLMEEHRPHLVLLDLVPCPAIDGIDLMQDLLEKVRRARPLSIRLRTGRGDCPRLRRAGQTTMCSNPFRRRN